LVQVGSARESSNLLFITSFEKGGKKRRKGEGIARKLFNTAEERELGCLVVHHVAADNSFERGEKRDVECQSYVPGIILTTMMEKKRPSWICMLSLSPPGVRKEETGGGHWFLLLNVPVKRM